jgi:hypothetical protein
MMNGPTLLSDALAAIENPLAQIEHLWRRELVVALSRGDCEAEARGHAWGRLLRINVEHASRDIAEFAPYD